MTSIRPTTATLAVAVAIAWAGSSGASVLAGALPVSGVPVPELAVFDQEMQDFMSQYDLTAGILAVSRDECVVYQRGFGWRRTSPVYVPLPENTPMRIASVEKPLTAATVRKLVGLGYFNLADRVFDLGQPGGGILNLDPWPSLGDSRLADITVEHLLLHRGGWDIGVMGYDPQAEAIAIALAMGIPSPPGRINTARYMLGQPLQYTPGTPPCDANGDPPGCYDGYQYSNFGYMLLGLIVEQEAGGLHVDRVRQHVLTPDLWVQASEVFRGRTFMADQSPREPIYATDRTAPNVFDPTGPWVNEAYGGWDHESLAGHGNVVVSAAPLLAYLQRYVVIGESIGMPLTGAPGNGGHAGLLTGTSTVATQLSDGTCIVVLFTKRHWGDDPHYAGAMGNIIVGLLDTVTWPTSCVDGSWVDFNASFSGYGGHNDPFHTMSAALAATSAGVKLRLKPGTSSWTGSLAARMRMDAPFGMATIGQ